MFGDNRCLNSIPSHNYGPDQFWHTYSSMAWYGSHRSWFYLEQTFLDFFKKNGTVAEALGSFICVQALDLVRSFTVQHGTTVQGITKKNISFIT